MEDSQKPVRGRPDVHRAELENIVYRLEQGGVLPEDTSRFFEAVYAVHEELRVMMRDVSRRHYHDYDGVSQRSVAAYASLLARVHQPIRF